MAGSESRIMGYDSWIDGYCWWLFLLDIVDGYCWWLFLLDIVDGYFCWILLMAIVDGYFCWILLMAMFVGYCWWLLLMVIFDGYCWWLLLLDIVDGYCWWLFLLDIVDGYCWWIWLMAIDDGYGWWILLIAIVDGYGWWIWLMDIVDGYCWWTWLMYIDGICQEECGQLVFSTIQNWNIDSWDVNGDTMGYVTNYIQLGSENAGYPKVPKVAMSTGIILQGIPHLEILQGSPGNPGKTATGVVFQKLTTPPSTAGCVCVCETGISKIWWRFFNSKTTLWFFQTWPAGK